jgi:hypothetical protein
MLNHNTYQQLIINLQFYADAVLNNSTKIFLEPSCVLDKGLFYSDILLKIGKDLRCDPKSYVQKLQKFIEPKGWQLIEEKGYAYFSPKTLDLLQGRFNFEKSNSEQQIDLILSPVNVHIEINYLRQNMLAYLYSKFAEYYDIKVRFYRFSEELILQEVTSAELLDYNFNLQFLQKNQLKFFAEALKASQYKGWVLGFHSQERQLSHVLQNTHLQLKALPLTWEIQESQPPESLPFWHLAKSKSLSTALHLAQDLPANFLDDYVISSSEQANLVHFAKSIRSRLSQIFPEYANIHFANVEFSSASKQDELQALILKVWSLPFHFQAAVLEVGVVDFLSMLRSAIDAFQNFFNSPNLRQKAANSDLSQGEKEIISAVYGLLNLCDSFLFDC